MTYIQDADEGRLATRLQAIQSSSVLTIFMEKDSHSSCSAMLDLVDYLVSLAPSRLRRNLEQATTSHGGPILRLSSTVHPDPRIEFWGAPSGHEFLNLVHAIELVAGMSHTLDSVTAALIHHLPTVTPVKIYVTPT